MTNAGEVTKKKAGSGLLMTGIVVAVLGALLVFMSVYTGGAGAPLSWGMVVVGAILAIAGYARRILAAVESR